MERIGATHIVSLGDYRDVVVTKEWTPLEPEIIEQQYHAPGVGKIYESQTAGERSHRGRNRVPIGAPRTRR